MHHDGVVIETGDSRQASETAARLQAAAGDQGIRVSAEDGRITIGLSNPGLAELLHAIFRLAAHIGHGLGSLFHRGQDGNDALPSRP